MHFPGSESESSSQSAGDCDIFALEELFKQLLISRTFKLRYNMLPRLRLCSVTLVISILLVYSGKSISADNKNQPKITPKIYSNIFVRRREEHKMFVKHLTNSNYEKTYKMLELGFDKILELINDNNMTLHQSGYNPTSGFPTESRLQDSVAVIVENICLGCDLVLHFPEISYRILRKRPKWKQTFDWGTKFLNNYAHILSEQTYEVVELFRQEVNLTKRSDNFVNPYYTKMPVSLSSGEKKEKKKPRKKLKRGPQLTGRVEL